MPSMHAQRPPSNCWRRKILPRRHFNWVPCYEKSFFICCKELKQYKIISLSWRAIHTWIRTFDVKRMALNRWDLRVLQFSFSSIFSNISVPWHLDSDTWHGTVWNPFFLYCTVHHQCSSTLLFMIFTAHLTQHGI